MKKSAISYTDARDRLLSLAVPVTTEAVPLAECYGRILAQDLTAEENVPAFDRSAYDGYAIRSSDVSGASPEAPVILRILEEIPAGSVSHFPLTEGSAVKILTGAPVPEGCDAVIPYESTRFTDTEVTLFGSCGPDANIVRAGEDVRAGALLAPSGTPIDAGLLASLAGQNVETPVCYRVPRIGVISTGSELLEVGDSPEPGKIRNTNRYSISGAIRHLGAEPVYLGIGRDSADQIAGLIRRGLESCDGVVLTGGVSAGDYDLTPDAMTLAGAEVLFHGVALKPGMACCYGMAGGRLIAGLSGNPASSLINLYAIAAPFIRKLGGRRDPGNREISVTLADGFEKSSPVTRLLWGTLDIADGTAVIRFPPGQGNVIISSVAGTDVLAEIPAGSGPVKKGTVCKGFLI